MSSVTSKIRIPRKMRCVMLRLKKATLRESLQLLMMTNNPSLHRLHRNKPTIRSRRKTPNWKMMKETSRSKKKISRRMRKSVSLMKAQRVIVKMRAKIIANIVRMMRKMAKAKKTKILILRAMQN